MRLLKQLLLPLLLALSSTAFAADKAPELKKTATQINENLLEIMQAGATGAF